MLQFVALYQWIVTFAYPAVNALVLVAYLYAAFRTMLRLPFAFLAFATGVLLFSQLVTLLLKVEQGTGLFVVSKEALRSIWPFTALAEYLSFAFYLVGVILLVRAVLAALPRRPAA